MFAKWGISRFECLWVFFVKLVNSIRELLHLTIDEKTSCLAVELLMAKRL
jgi:hypothetical protein